MAGLSNKVDKHQKLREFLKKWPLEKVRQMTLVEYSDVGSKETFCYWLEFETEELGRIGGKPSNKFGIWKRKSNKALSSKNFLTDNGYAWYTKYGNNIQDAFNSVKNHVINIIESSIAGKFREIDGIDLDSLAKWKIAFLYSSYSLLPVYKNEIIREIAHHFDYYNSENAQLSDLHTFIVKQKPEEDDLFEFALKYYLLIKMEFSRNYYIIGSKYSDNDGNDNVNIIDFMLKKSVIANGFFWNYDFSHLYKHSYQDISKWCYKNIKDKTGKYASGQRTLGYFLQLKPGDIIAVKSHGQFGKLTIIAYAEVVEVEGKVYKHDGGEFPNSLGHIIHVEFLETNLWIETGLSYGQTIHRIIPDEKKGHFEKIFGSYAFLDDDKIDNEKKNVDEEEKIVLSVEEDRINEKQTEATYREVSYTTLVNKTHNKIQIAFAKFLKKQFPYDIVRTETNNIDIKRENATEIYIYEVKPYNSAFSCIRAGIGQLLDYCHSNPNKSKTIHLIIVGTVNVLSEDLKFIDFVKNTLKISFDYIAFNNLIEN